MILNDQIMIHSEEELGMDVIGEAREQHALSLRTMASLMDLYIDYANSCIQWAVESGFYLPRKA